HRRVLGARLEVTRPYAPDFHKVELVGRAEQIGPDAAMSSHELSPISECFAGRAPTRPSPALSAASETGVKEFRFFYDYRFLWYSQPDIKTQVAAQTPVRRKSFEEKVSVAAWRTRPSRYGVSEVPPKWTRNRGAAAVRPLRDGSQCDSPYCAA